MPRLYPAVKESEETEGNVSLTYPIFKSSGIDDALDRRSLVTH